MIILFIGSKGVQIGSCGKALTIADGGHSLLRDPRTLNFQFCRQAGISLENPVHMFPVRFFRPAGNPSVNHIGRQSLWAHMAEPMQQSPRTNPRPQLVGLDSVQDDAAYLILIASCDVRPPNDIEVFRRICTQHYHLSNWRSGHLSDR